MTSIPNDIPKALENLKGDVTPILKLLPELIAAGASVRLCPDQLSLHGEGDKNAAGDWYHDNHEYRVFYRTKMHSHHVFHELLHLKFALAGMKSVRAVPTSDARFTHIIQELNNDLDHIVVVPAEIAVYPQAQEHWVEQFTKRLKGVVLKSPTADNMLSNKFALLTCWPVLHRAMPHHILTRKFKDAIFRFDWASDAALVNGAVDQNPLRKELWVDALRTALQANKFPPNEKIRFHSWIDVANK